MGNLEVSAVPQMWTTWLHGLPCQQDEEEGKRNHKLLVQFASQERPEVLGANGAHLPKILQVIVEVYKGEMVDEETSKGIGQLALKWGQGVLEANMASLSDAQRKKLGRI